MLVVLGLGLMAGCGRPGMAEDESDLPWAEPENWEGGPGIGIGG
jgi:hypothetical protein